MARWKKVIPAYLYLGAGDTQLYFLAQSAGTNGNNIRVRIVVAGTNTALSVSVSSNDITINLATNGSSVATSTASQVVTAVNASSPAFALVLASTGHVGPGVGVPSAVGYTNLANGAAQVPPTWDHSYPSKDGWRSNNTGELLVSDYGAVALKASAALVQNVRILRAGGDSHYQSGTLGHNDEILLAVELDKPAYMVFENIVDGSSNEIKLATSYRPANITVNIIDPGVASAALTGEVKYINFGDQLVVNIYLATNGSSVITSTYANINTYCTNNNIPFQSGDSGTAVAEVLSGPWTASVPDITVPIIIGSNTRQMTLKDYPRNFLGFQQATFNQNTDFESVLPVTNAGTLLFGYTVVAGDQADAGEVFVGVASEPDTHNFGSGTSEITFNAETNGAGSGITIALLAPVTTNNPTLSSGVTSTDITYNLVTAGASNAVLALGSANTQISFTAVTKGTGGNSITITIVTGVGALSVGVVGTAITITTDVGGSNVTAVIAEIAGTPAAAALVIAATTGNGSGTVGDQTLTSLATGTNSSVSTTPTILEAFVATDPNSVLVNTTGTTGTSGVLVAAAQTALTGGVDATATITFTDVSITDEQNATIPAVFDSPDTSAISVN